MLEKSYFPRLFASVLAASLALCGAGAWASTDPMAAEVSAAEADRLSDASPARLVAELQQRIRDKSVRELRASANGEYATTLMLAEDEVVCYVGLLYQNKLWRVSRFSSLASAESAYRKATAQSAALADQAIRRQVLATEQRQVERAIQSAEAQADALATELRAEQTQREQFNEDQKMVRAENESREADNRSARSQLAKLRQEIRRLEASLADSGQKLPVPEKTRR
ncbi:hypothetical protein D3C87_1311840 [compost metagenome]|uniref:DUF2968 domain-containing protein n=1 Tax=Cupriavidus campinensis TaxID=151783 RepID=A0AAE9L265_9BURK|nr:MULTISPECIES: DUF2968 domain-containing protein [Cupriavidus]TSP14445.1 DUF2968 domain-containing protein [Cupriavidus campinensis]URF05517.1 DUF2968 domain-containing protein [Cupriavidus campinensis]CAG2155241.1 hypothetical protein LMG19282_04870 [Cupriavidus campinensis]